MAAKSLKCPKCERKFSMPAHLARHVSTIHAVTSRKKKAAKRARKSKAKRRVGRPKGSGKKKVGRPRKRVAATAVAIGRAGARLVADMRSFHNDLLAQREALDGEITGLASAVEALGGATPAPARRKKRAPKRAAPARRGRRRSAGRLRTGSLSDHVFRVLKKSKRPLRPADISAKVVAAGYSSKAKDLAKAVSNSLAKLKGVKRVGVGMYRL